MKTIWGLKDTLKVRLDMKKQIRPGLHPVDDGGNGVTVLSVTPYVLSKSENTVFLKIICELMTPSNYVGQLSKKITVDGELRGLKSHDYHIFFYQKTL